MVLLACAVMALALFAGAGVVAIGLVREVAKAPHQRDDVELVRLGWKAGGLVLAGVLVVIAGMLMG